MKAFGTSIEMVAEALDFPVIAARLAVFELLLKRLPEGCDESVN